ncbi:hypothetical protein WICPIJ_009166 [Wickerhamomyces pijperi]|uniref:Uncharacterized protein n=1 Tax=Wickerhamomyces pijperi TaxID=599730 RepID=A0A9P8TF96_WICPI|nr:hypothetical protein WICPIJ_009166 [Wickerhamomyces pijperi]
MFFSVKLLFTLLKRTPSLLVTIFLFISVFLLSFLLLGCFKVPSTYSSVYLVKYQFNQTNPMYSLIAKSFTESNSTVAYDKLTVKANYLYVCMQLNSTLNCQSRTNVLHYKDLTEVKLYTTSSSSTPNTINPIVLASKFSTDIIHPYLLIITIILAIGLFLMVLYGCVPSLPYKTKITKINLVLSLILTLFSGLTAIWGHISSKSGKELVEIASMNIIQAHIGKKAQALHWTPFSFFVLVNLMLVWLYVREVKGILKGNETAMGKA